MDNQRRDYGPWPGIVFVAIACMTLLGAMYILSH